MSTSNRIGAAFACAFGIAIAGSAEAQDLYGPPPFGNLVWQQGGWYGSIGGRFENRSIGPVNTWRFLAPGTAHLSVEPNPNLGGPSGAIGYAFREGTVPPWLGQNFRVELSGWWLTGSDSAASGGIFPVGTVSNIALVSGRTVNTGVLVSTFDEQASAKATMDLFRMRLRVAGDFPLHPQWVLSPFVGAAGGRTQLKYSLRVNESIGGAPFINYVQNANIRWTDVGGTAGARMTYNAMSWLQLHVSGHADLVHRSARLNADDCANFTAAFGAPCTGGIGSSSVSASARTFAVIAGGEVGLTYNGGYYLLTIAGGAEYDSRVPQIAPQQPGPAAGTTGTPASLRFSGQVNYNASLRLTLRF